MNGLLFKTLKTMVINVAENLMSRLNPKWVERFKKLKEHEKRVALIRDYPIQSPEEEAVIQLLIDKLDPATPSVTRVSQVREAMQREEAKGATAEHRLDTREGEEYWQKKLDEAAKLDELDRAAEMARRHAEIKKLFPELLPSASNQPNNQPLSRVPAVTVNMKTGEAKIGVPAVSRPSSPQVPVTDSLNAVPGFGKKVVDSFMSHGVTCQKQLFDLTYSQALAIAKTPLVLAKIKDKFKPEK